MYCGVWLTIFESPCCVGYFQDLKFACGLEMIDCTSPIRLLKPRLQVDVVMKHPKHFTSLQSFSEPCYSFDQYSNLVQAVKQESQPYSTYLTCVKPFPCDAFPVLKSRSKRSSKTANRGYQVYGLQNRRAAPASRCAYPIIYPI